MSERVPLATPPPIATPSVPTSRATSPTPQPIVTPSVPTSRATSPTPQPIVTPSVPTLRAAIAKIYTGEQCALSKIICNVSDGAPNQFGEVNGFNGLLTTEIFNHIGTRSQMTKQHCFNHQFDLQEENVTGDDHDLREMVQIIERVRREMEANDFAEDLIKYSAIHRIKLKFINKDFGQRWVMFMSAAFGAVCNNIDIIIYVLLLWLINNKDKNDQNRTIEKRNKRINLLRDLVSYYFRFFIYAPILLRAGLYALPFPPLALPLLHLDQ